MTSQFPALIGTLIEQIPERLSPETFRALHRLWLRFNPLTLDPFPAELANDLSTRLKAQNCVRWSAKAQERVQQAVPRRARPAAGQSADPFARKELRENAIKKAAEELGCVKQVAEACQVDYRAGLRRWARKRVLGKGKSDVQDRIATFLLPYAR
jgi:hypothetical protein